MSSLSESRQRTHVYIGYEQLPMCGINVQLPQGLKPYTSQKQMMAKILLSLNKRLNALIESPTGSGKTLALLASSLPWLVDYKRQRREAREKCAVHGPQGSQNKRPSVVTESVPPVPDIIKFDAEPSTPSSNLALESDSPIVISNAEEEYDMDWCNETLLGKRRSSSTGGAFSTPQSSSSKRSRLEKETDEEVETGCSCKPRVRIYYGTRTHKQISQVVKEFSRLPFAADIKHTILASREQSCINKKARAAPDLTAYCKELLAPDGGGCNHNNALRPKYDNDYKMRTYLKKHAPPVWDMEDLVAALGAATPTGICPYFASNRVLNEDADIIFCPFNYLIVNRSDPIIRDASDMKLKNSVVILDEAHNVEDTCRDSASFVFTEKEIYDALFNLREMKMKTVNELNKHNLAPESELRVQLEGMRDHYEVAVPFVEELLRWCNDIGNNVQEIKRLKQAEYEENGNKQTVSDGKVEKKNPPNRWLPKYTAIRSWAYLDTSLQSRQFNILFKEDSEDFKKLMTAVAGLMGRSDGSKEADKEDHLKSFRPISSTAIVIEKFTVFLRYYTKNNYNTTYRMFINIERPYEFSSSRQNSRKSLQPPMAKSVGEWLSTNNTHGDNYSPILKGYSVTINLWCMNPAVSFLDAFSESWSVVLASGTLCPTETFQSELGVDFKVRMEGDQVIPKEQIFASVVPAGPNGRTLRATYENTANNDSVFFRELSHVVKSVCDIVPFGVLCFFPSYRLLEQLYDHIKSNGVLRHIESIKEVICEPRRSSDLSSAFKTFEDAVAMPKNFGGDRTGALMLAVFRGKVSEGIDFTDNLARCVITVGIPYPNTQNEQIKEKKRYNTENEKLLNLVNGEQWYTTQAYRALNQALGRCLRHREDWGALVMVDDRFLPTGVQPGNSKKISKWVRQQLLVFPSFQDFETGLSSFVSKMTADKSLKSVESSTS